LKTFLSQLRFRIFPLYCLPPQIVHDPVFQPAFGGGRTTWNAGRGEERETVREYRTWAVETVYIDGCLLFFPRTTLSAVHRGIPGAWTECEYLPRGDPPSRFPGCPGSRSGDENLSIVPQRGLSSTVPGTEELP